MTAQVWKFPIEAVDAFGIDMPIGAEILSVQTQHGQPHLWALVDTMLPNERRLFRLFGTGHSIDDSGELKYVGSFQLSGGALVFHLFEYPKVD